ncbi:putative ubiquitinyl hydrolase 1 [Helianthus annuus]|nr:putative ubiquitinyl hydrolase 1 [Helianthus annuus]
MLLTIVAGFSQDEEIELYEIEDGDIICFQKLPKAEEKYRYRRPFISRIVKNRQIVHFRSLDRPKEDDFCLELSKLHTYDDVVERVAQKLNLDDPSKIRLTPHNCYFSTAQTSPHQVPGCRTPARYAGSLQSGFLYFYFLGFRVAYSYSGERFQTLTRTHIKFGSTRTRPVNPYILNESYKLTIYKRVVGF